MESMKIFAGQNMPCNPTNPDRVQYVTWPRVKRCVCARLNHVIATAELVVTEQGAAITAMHLGHDIYDSVCGLWRHRTQELGAFWVVGIEKDNDVGLRGGHPSSALDQASRKLNQREPASPGSACSLINTSCNPG